MVSESRIGPRQTGGVHAQVLFGITTYKFGQQGGTNTVDPAMDALEGLLKTDIGATGVGMPNGLGDPSSILSALGTAKRFPVFAAPLVPYANAGAGSMDRLVNSSTYDAAHHLSAQKLVAWATAHGREKDHACRFGHEYNTQVGQVGNYPWATGFIDPYTGNPVTISLYHAAAAKVEGIYRSEGWQGYAAWSGGTSNSSALPIATAIPTHGDPAQTIWDFDCYIGTRYGTTKNDYASGWPLVRDAWLRYDAYCSTHGVMMASSEFNNMSNVASPYFLNDAAGAAYFGDLYGLFKTLSPRMAWALLYQVNQFTAGVVDEEHDMFLSVSTPGGPPSGTGPTAEYTAPYPPGKSDLISGKGTNSLAVSGSLDNSSSAGLNFIWSPSKNRQHSIAALKTTFGGYGTTGGANGLRLPQTVPVIPTGPASPVNGKRRTRRQYSVYK